MNTSSIPEMPGSYLLKRYLIPLKISQNKLARDLDVEAMRICDIVRGRRSITADTALRLAQYFRTSPEMWLNLQMEYDLYNAHHKNGRMIREMVRECPHVL